MSSPTCEDYATLKPVTPPRPATPDTGSSYQADSGTAFDAGPSSFPGTAKPEAGKPEKTNTTETDRHAQSKLVSPGELPRLSHYRILRLLGQGGMGKVYQAEDTRLQRVVALKVMLPELSGQPSSRDRFLREARTMAAVRNDHVVTIFEVDEADGVPFLAMEFLKGQTLEEWNGTGQAPRATDILRIGREIAEGLAGAQTCGLIHRDVKPANIWIEAGTGRAKLLDFGLARPTDTGPGLTHTGAILGTPCYMAPEQARGDHVDGRADLFSLGVVLYQLCTQQLPFRGNSITAVLTALAIDQPAPIAGLNPNIPAELAGFVMQLLEKDPGRRPESAEKVVAALAALEGQLATTPSSFLQRSVTQPTGQSSTAGRNAVKSALFDPAHPSTIALPFFRGRRKTVAGGVAASLLLLSGLCWWCLAPAARPDERKGLPGVALPSGPPIRVGVLYSRTGTMANSERSILDGVLLAIGEINEKGGVLGRPIEAVIEDGQSDETVFAHKAARLIDRDNVQALFGCWTSSSRRAVEAVVEKRDHLLCYPVSYEGMEQSPNVVYGGSVPNQHILPALRWSYGFLNKKRWFLVGSDSVSSHASHAVVRDEAKSLGSQIVGEEYLPCGSTEVAALVGRIAKAKPDLIVNTVLGDSNVALFRALRRAGITPARAPTLSFAVSEEELTNLAPQEIRGHLAAGNYFQSVDLPRNREFLRLVQAKYGPEQIVSDPMQTSYSLVHLWAQAVQSAGTEDVHAVRKALKGQHYDSPQGLVTIDPATQHTIQVSRVGRINASGRFIEVFVSPQPVLPEPFPTSRSRPEWEQLLQDLFKRWNGHWHNAAP